MVTCFNPLQTISHIKIAYQKDNLCIIKTRDDENDTQLLFVSIHKNKKALGFSLHKFDGGISIATNTPRVFLSLLLLM